MKIESSCFVSSNKRRSICESCRCATNSKMYPCIWAERLELPKGAKVKKVVGGNVLVVICPNYIKDKPRKRVAYEEYVNDYIFELRHQTPELLKRQEKLVKLIEEKPRTSISITQELNCSKNVFYKDIAELRAKGTNIVKVKGFYYIES